MIPLRIHLTNFLTYGTAPNGGPVEFDFEGAKLWSIAGRNGSGKSAIFDAITWSLFGEHRGGAREDRRLVRQGCTRGGVAFEFRLGNLAYRVARSLSLGAKAATTKRQASSLDTVTGTWQPIPNTDTAGGFASWVEEGLGLRYDTFVASTLLLQGHSDRLILAKPKDRFEVLAGMLDLRAYQAIGTRASDRARSRTAELKTAETNLASAPAVADGAIETADAAVASAVKALEAAQSDVEEARLSVEEAARAARLGRDLRARRERQATVERLIERAELIAAEHAEWLELKAAIPVLRTVVEEAARANGLATEGATIATQILAIDVAQLDARCSASAAAEHDAEAALAGARERLVVCARDLAEANARMQELERCEEIERLIADGQSELRRIEAGQADATKVHARLRELELVRDATPLVRAVGLAEAGVRRRAKRCAELGTSAHTRGEIETANQAVEEQSAVRGYAVAARDEANRIVALARVELSTAVSRLQQRRDAADEGLCSRCGQPVDGEHITKELTQAESEVDVAKERLATASSTTSAAAQALANAEAQLAVSAQRLDALARRLVEVSAAEDELKDAQATLGAAITAIDSTSPETAAAARALLALPETEREVRMAALPGLNALTQESMRLRAEEGRATGVREQLARMQADLGPLRARLPDAERSSRRCRQAALVAEQNQINDDLKERQGAVRAAADEREADLSARTEQLERRDQLVVRATALDTEALELRARAEGRVATLPVHWTSQLGAEGGQLLTAAEERFGALTGAEERRDELTLAQQEHQQLVATIASVQAELDEIPLERRQTALDAETRRANAVRVRDDSVAECERTRRGADLLREQCARHVDLEREAQEARHSAHLATRLAELLGRTRLQAHLMKNALRELERIANEMLVRISGGRLEVRLALRPSGGEEYIEIQAIDYTSSDEPLEIAFISGGQKFRVAVALAAAIGQHMGGGRAGRCLIVDEGFGSLDDDGRRDMIKELQEVAPLMDRVIVVSHHEDFRSRDLFPSGFLIGKDDRTTTVERIV